MKTKGFLIDNRYIILCVNIKRRVKSSSRKRGMDKEEKN